MIQLADSNDETVEAPALSGKVESCLICGNPNYGLHFQVATCRACAAFFRRSVKAKRQYKCRRGTKNCDILDNSANKPICRFCRLQKCYTVGMTYEWSVNEASSESEEKEKEEAFTITLVDGNRVSFDAERFISEIKNVLNLQSSEAPSTSHSSKLQQLHLSLSKFRTELKPAKHLQPVDSYDKLAVQSFLVKYCKKTAQLLMTVTEFSDLAFEDKFNLFKHSWNVIRTLEREYTSIEMYGADLSDSKCLLTDTIAISRAHSVPFIEGADPAKTAEMRRLCVPLREERRDKITNPMKELQLTPVEFSYMIALSIFSIHEVKNLSPDARAVGDQMLSQYSSELHRYYCNELKMNNYGARLVKIVKLVQNTTSLNAAVKDRFVMGKIFNIITSDIWDSELYS